jgi:hypothetical protein
MMNMENMSEMLFSHSLYPFTYKLGMTAEQVEQLTDRAKEELQEPRLKLYVEL